MSILVLNAGSSTLKFALFDGGSVGEVARGVLTWAAGDVAAEVEFTLNGAAASRRSIAASDEATAVDAVLALLRETGAAAEIRLVGHRVVHGGVTFRQPARIDAEVLEVLRSVADLAPLHNPPALATIGAAMSRLPDAEHVAVFDTAFFASLPLHAVVYPTPYEWYEKWGIRRFGFHGISHAYCSERAAQMLSHRNEPLRMITLHLGNGCSASAVVDGTPVATTMGFTPLEGLMMGTRSGSIDPGIIMRLLQDKHLDSAELDDALNRRSGLLGVSGVSSDMRQVLEAAERGNSRAGLAVTMFVDRARAAVGSLAVSMGGVDALVFTGGIGEHAAAVRAWTCRGLECLGLRLDGNRNRDCRGDQDIAVDASTGRILVIETREDQRIAQEAAGVAARPGLGGV